MADLLRVEVDDGALRRDLARLGVGLTRVADEAEMGTARVTAEAIRRTVPVLTGRLRATVDAVSSVDGAAVRYGGTLRYARKIERRTHAVETAVALAPTLFERAMRAGADREVGRT